MLPVPHILEQARVSYTAFTGWRDAGVYLTRANQLLGTYDDLKRGASSDRRYMNWHAHHVVESQDLKRLGIDKFFPERGQQLCVLIPGGCHIERINSRLRYHNPGGVVVSVAHLREAYEDAYSIMGDYCGGGEAALRRELMDIVDATFWLGGLR